MKALENVSAEIFVATDAIEDTFGKELDLFYSPPVEARLNALGYGWAMRTGHGVLTIGSLESGIKG